MGNLLIFTFTLLLYSNASAQDERFFRQLFAGDLAKEGKTDDQKKYSYVIHSPYYALDLTRDGKEESIVFAKKDSEDWLEIFDKDKKKIYSYQFEAKGYGSELFKIELKTLSPSTTVLLLYYYEGISKYIEFQGTSRIYAMTLDDNDLQTLQTLKGPSFFDEFKSQKGHYHKRNYQVYLDDLNGDSVKELVIKHQRMSNVYLYLGKGKWTTFKQQF